MREEILRELFPSIWEAQNQEAESLMTDRKPISVRSENGIEHTPAEKISASLEPVPKYHSEEGESVPEYLRRNHADLFLAGILAEGVTDDREILKATRKGYRDMWNGSITVLCPKYRKYHDDPDIKRQREIIIAVLDGALEE